MSNMGRPAPFLFGATAGDIPERRFITVDHSTQEATLSDGTTIDGISMGIGEATSGTVVSVMPINNVQEYFIEVGGSIAVGDQITSDAIGRAIVDVGATSELFAREASSVIGSVIRIYKM